MKRRQFLAAGATASVACVAGCFGDDDGSDDADGYGPEPDTVPEERSIDTNSYETQEFEGDDVPLAPIDDVFYWYQRQEARMVDARGSDQYEEAHVVGAALSSAPDGVSNDPVAEWSRDDRIVTYCGCPHHLSGLRAASLIENEHEEVYALDEGFIAWLNREYPVSGSEVSADRESYEIRGQSDPAHAGEMIWLEDLSAERYEAAPIADDGTYAVTLHFTGLTDDSMLKLEAPDYTLRGTLGEFTSGVVTG
ncbi:rhodanese-like domain-containing protein [Natronococcus wangiae]|uniref:rhodanese-like domain-containing protein n=1 Tax=Natronococcus wangiae TaxID=3068275 RepID=UPI00273E0D6A|nr:rhodanese-like domain-containing protein [Natronococcus sp. AD5]